MSNLHLRYDSANDLMDSEIEFCKHHSKLFGPWVDGKLLTFIDKPGFDRVMDKLGNEIICHDEYDTTVDNEYFRSAFQKDIDVSANIKKWSKLIEANIETIVQIEHVNRNILPEWTRKDILQIKDFLNNYPDHLIIKKDIFDDKATKMNMNQIAYALLPFQRRYVLHLCRFLILALNGILCCNVNFDDSLIEMFLTVVDSLSKGYAIDLSIPPDMAVLAILLAKLGSAAGFPDGALNIRPTLKVISKKNNIYCKKNGCIISIFKKCDMESAIDTLIGGLRWGKGSLPWNVNKIFVQESTWEQFKKIIGNKEIHASLPSRMKLTVEKNNKLTFKLIEENEKNSFLPASICIETFRTSQELSKLINVYNDMAISIWCDDSAVSYDVAFSAKTKIVWINSYGFNSLPYFSTFVDYWEELPIIQYEDLVSEVKIEKWKPFEDCLNKSVKDGISWNKLTALEKEYIFKSLEQCELPYVGNDKMNQTFSKIRNALLSYKGFFQLFKNEVIVKKDTFIMKRYEPVGVIVIEFGDLEYLQFPLILSLLIALGNSVIVLTNNAIIFDTVNVLSEKGLPIIATRKCSNENYKPGKRFMYITYNNNRCIVEHFNYKLTDWIYRENTQKYFIHLLDYFCTVKYIYNNYGNN